MADAVIGGLEPGLRRRLDAAIGWPASLAELRCALGPRFHELVESVVEGAVVFVHRDTLAVVEAEILTGDQLGARAVIAGDDARVYLADLLGRIESMQAILELLESLQASAPIVLEVMPRGRRMLLSRGFLAVVEVRGRRKVDSVRLLGEVESAGAVDAVLRLIPDRSGLVGRFSDVRDFGDGRFGLLGGCVAAEPVEGRGGYQLLWGDLLREWLVNQIRGAENIDAADALVSGVFEEYGRRESVGEGGSAVVTWRLIPLGVDVSRGAEGTVCCGYATP